MTLQGPYVNNRESLEAVNTMKKVQKSEQRDFMESIEGFQRNRSVIQDFTSRTLAVIPSDFGRLYYVSSLKDSETGRYQHDGLRDVYSEDSVQEALTHCHEELFSRILETPLKDQERDLLKCLDAAGDQFWPVVESWRETKVFTEMCPDGLPSYLNDLFSSNMAAMLDIILTRQVNLGLAS
jgi:hypothetical protein